VLLAVVGLALIGGLAFLNPYLDSDGDNGGYIMLARSIASGQGFTSINFPFYSPHTFYQPLYPLVLAPLVAFWPENYLLPKIPSLLFVMAFVGAVWVLMRPRVGGHLWTLGLLCAAVAWNRSVAEHAAATVKEAQYLMISFWTLALAERWTDSARVREGVYLGLLSGAAYLTWPMGIAVGGAVIVPLLLRRRRAAALAAVIVLALPVVGWSLRNAHVLTPDNRVENVTFGNDGNAGEVLNRSTFHPERGRKTPPEMAAAYVRHLRRNLTPLAQISHPVFTVGLVAVGREGSDVPTFAAPLIALMLIGWIRCVRAFPRSAEWYIFFYLGLLMLYPFSRGRYMLPIMPLALYYLVRGVDGVVDALRRRSSPLPGPAGIAGLLVLGSAVLLSGLLLFRQARFTWQDNFGPKGAENLYDRVDRGASPYFRAGRWLRHHSEPDAVIMAMHPWLLYLIADRHTTVYYLGDDRQKSIDVFHRHHVDYVIEDTRWYWQTREFFQPLLRAYPRAFRLVHTEAGPPTNVYHVDRSQFPPPSWRGAVGSDRRPAETGAPRE